MIHTNILYEATCPICGSNNIKEYLYHSECQDCGYTQSHIAENENN